MQAVESKGEAIMTKSEQKAFRTNLERIQSELINGNKTREILVAETSPDDLDRIQNAAARDESMRSFERNSNRLIELKLAIQRIDQGTYGVCAECEEDINPKRLAAVPWASHCIVCQEAADREEQADLHEIDSDFVMAA